MSELRVTFAAQTYPFQPGQTVKIGRSPENSVVVSDPIVSREHAQVRWRDDTWVLDDLGKGRTFVGGLAVNSVPIHQPVDVHLASPLGPVLRIELAVAPVSNGATARPTATATAATALAGASATNTSATNTSATNTSATSASATNTSATSATRRPEPIESAGSASTTSIVHFPSDEAIDGSEQSPPPKRSRADRRSGVRHASAVHRSRLWRGDISASHTSPVYIPEHHDRLESPGEEFATAVHILVPVRSWLKDPGWKQGSRLLVIAYGLLPSLFVVLFSGTTNVNVPGWAYSLAIAPLWSVAFWLLIRPGRITRLIAWLAVFIVAAVLVLLPVLTLPWEHALDKTSNFHNVLPWIYGVGLAEEVTKALPILIAALALRWVWKITLDVRVWMFLGTIAGLTFGVRESVYYTSSYLMQGNHKAGLAIPLILSFAQRVFVDGFQHAVWAGIAAFFIGMGVNYRRRRIPLIVFGITLPAVLHGLNDWSTELASHWLWIMMEAVSLLLFIGYTMSAAAIERQVRDTPLFRGESMIMDRIKLDPHEDNPST